MGSGSSEARVLESGSAFLELAIVLIFLLPLAAGLFFFGTIFWQVQVAADAVRHGARMAAYRSNFSDTCSALSNLAESETSAYLGGEGYPRINRGVNWVQPPVIAFRADERDGLNLSFISVTLPRSTENENCAVCIDRLYDFFDVEIITVFALEAPVDLSGCL